MTPKILTDEELSKMEEAIKSGGSFTYAATECLIFSLRASRQEAETLKAENERLANNLDYVQEEHSQVVQQREFWKRQYVEQSAELSRIKEAIPSEERIQVAADMEYQRTDGTISFAEIRAFIAGASWLRSRLTQKEGRQND